MPLLDARGKKVGSGPDLQGALDRLEKMLNEFEADVLKLLSAIDKERQGIELANDAIEQVKRWYR